MLAALVAISFMLFVILKTVFPPVSFDVPNVMTPNTPDMTGTFQALPTPLLFPTNTPTQTPDLGVVIVELSITATNTPEGGMSHAVFGRVKAECSAGVFVRSAPSTLPSTLLFVVDGSSAMQLSSGETIQIFGETRTDSFDHPIWYLIPYEFPPGISGFYWVSASCIQVDPADVKFIPVVNNFRTPMPSATATKSP
jgi:hypothetical protein